MDLSNYTNKGAAARAHTHTASHQKRARSVRSLAARETFSLSLAANAHIYIFTYTAHIQKERERRWSIQHLRHTNRGESERARGFDFGGLINKDGTYTCARRQTRATAAAASI